MSKFKTKPKMDKPKDKQHRRVQSRQMQTMLENKAKRAVKEASRQQIDTPEGSSYAVDQAEQAGSSTMRSVASGESTITTKLKRKIQSRTNERKQSHYAKRSSADSTHHKTSCSPYSSQDHAGTSVSPRMTKQRSNSMVGRPTSVARSESTKLQSSRNRINPSIRFRPYPVSSRAFRSTDTISSKSALKGRRQTAFRTRSASAPKRTLKKLKVKPVGGKIKVAAKQAQKVAQQHVTRRAAEMAKQAAKAALKATIKLAQAVAHAVASLIGALVGLIGGGGLLVLIIMIAAIAAVVSSPFGLFFASKTAEPAKDTIEVYEAVAQINEEYNGKLEDKKSGSYDTLVMFGYAPDWADVLAVFGAKYAAADDGVDVATLDSDRVNKLTDVFWDMTTITSVTESIYHEDTNEDDDIDDSYTETVLTIGISAKTAAEMAAEYSFDDFQQSALDSLLDDPVSLRSLAGCKEITDEDMLAVMSELPPMLSEQRRNIVNNALTLVGKVGYFWGGKYHAVGWNTNWGQLAEVVAPGSDTTGTYKPLGLDCTGFLDWTLRNAGLQSDGLWHIGTNLTAVSSADALPGDFALNGDNSHIGLVVGRDEDGELLICHCSPATDGVAVSRYTDSGFVKVGRPNVYDE